MLFGRTIIIKSLAALLFAFALSTNVNAAILLSFGKQVSATGPVLTASHNGTGVTTLTSTDAPVTVTAWIFGGPDFNAFLNLNAVSFNSATLNDGAISQRFGGSFSLYSGAGMTGINYLSGTYTATVGAVASGENGGTSLTFQAGNPPGNLSFTSSIIPPNALLSPNSFSFNIGGTSAFVSIVGSSLNSFTAENISGIANASQLGPIEPLPEPASVAIWGLGAVGLALFRSRRRKTA